MIKRKGFGTMRYTAERKKEMDAIFEAFEGFVQKQDYFDIVYSEKAGYLRILVEDPEEGAISLDKPEKMLEYLCSDVINDVVYSPDNPKKSHDDRVLTAYEETESRRRLTAILETLNGGKGRAGNLVDQYIRAYQGTAED